MATQFCRQRSAVLLFAAAATIAPTLSQASPPKDSRAFWHDVPAQVLPGAPALAAFRSLRLDVSAMAAYFRPARHGGASVTFSLPLPGGGFSEFLLTDSRTMPDE